MLVKFQQISIVVVLLVTLTSLILPPAAFANGRTSKFMKKEVGPYEISLGTIPDTPVLGQLHLVMTVIDLSSNTFVQNAQIAVVARSPDSDSVVIGPLIAETNSQAPTFYDVSISVEEEGVWTFTVSVRSSLDSVSTDFELLIKKRNPFFSAINWISVAFFATVIGLGLLPYLRERYKRR